MSRPEQQRAGVEAPMKTTVAKWRYIEVTCGRGTFQVLQTQPPGCYSAIDSSANDEPLAMAVNKMRKVQDT